MPLGIMDGAVWRPVGSFGYGKGRHGQNVPLLFVDHIMSGFKATMDRPGWQEAAGISAHFGIGKDGSISQYVNLFDAAWAQGVVGAIGPNDRRGIEQYNRANPRLAELERRGEWRYITDGSMWTLTGGGVNVWNCAAVAIEHEGFTGEVWTQAMLDASCAVKRWVNDELASAGHATIPYSVEGIIGHNDIDAIDRPGCPGTGRDLGKMIAQLNAGGDDMYVRHNKVAEWFEARELGVGGSAGRGEMTARADFALPQEAKRVEFNVYLDSGNMSFYDGTRTFTDGPTLFAGEVGNRGVMVATITAALSHDGVVKFEWLGNTRVGRIVSLGYWK